MSDTTNTQPRYGVILTTGGESNVIETESFQIFVTPHLPEYNLPARVFSRQDKSGDAWVEASTSATEASKVLANEIKVSAENGEIEVFTTAAQRMLQARLLSVSADYSGAYLVPLTSEDIDTLVNVAFPELPESVIARALEVVAE